jgi:hypothetical protein
LDKQGLFTGFCDRLLTRLFLTVSRSFDERCQQCVVKNGDHLKANIVNLIVSSFFFVFLYHSPNFLDAPCIMNQISSQTFIGSISPPPSKLSNENLQILLNSPFLVTLLIDFIFSNPIYTLPVNENQFFTAHYIFHPVEQPSIATYFSYITVS